jgi:hypothetical protein
VVEPDLVLIDEAGVALARTGSLATAAQRARPSAPTRNGGLRRARWLWCRTYSPSLETDFAQAHRRESILRAERRDNFPLVTSGLCAEIELAPTFAIPAVAVAGLPREAVDVANVLGLLPSQLAPTRDEALEAELDVPPGRWRVWPTRGVGLWVGRDTSPPPLARLRALYRLDSPKPYAALANTASGYTRGESSTAGVGASRCP